MIHRFPAFGLYAIVNPEHKSADEVVTAVAAAVAGGAKVIQYRGKNGRRTALAQRLKKLCHECGIPLIVNDDLKLAQEIGADGVHLGRSDGSPAKARRMLGENAIIGVSCYDSIERALAARNQGASYAAFGRFFPSKTKPGAAPAAIATLSRAKEIMDIPIVAIGGITPDNGAELLREGADLLAVVEGIFGSGDPEAAARRYSMLFAAGEGRARQR